MNTKGMSTYASTNTSHQASKSLGKSKPSTKIATK
jgi:hypothetical protein